MKNSQRFYSEKNCAKAIDILKSVSGENGIENFEGESVLSKEEANNAIEQFEIAKLDGGKYFPSIISEPHFSATQICCILDYIPLIEFSSNS